MQLDAIISWNSWQVLRNSDWSTKRVNFNKQIETSSCLAITTYK